jgi:hypothetical protein
MISAALARYLALGGAVLIALAAVYVWGRQDEKIDGLTDTIEAQQTREKIDADVRADDRYAICVGMRGLPEQCAKLRGMEKATKPD